MEIGESVESAVIREVQEETNLTIALGQLQQFRMYSDPMRDQRRHTVSMVFRVRLEMRPSQFHNGDDAKEIKMINLKEVSNLPLAFDHRQILHDYIHTYHPSLSSREIA